jgi:hypothetical protein
MSMKNDIFGPLPSGEPVFGLKPLELKHSLAMQILGIRPSYYWQLMREGRIRALGSGKNSRADYETIEQYHRERQAAAKARKAKANEETAVE